MVDKGIILVLNITYMCAELKHWYNFIKVIEIYGHSWIEL